MNGTPLLTEPPRYRFAVFALLLFPYLLIYMGIQIVSSLGLDIMEALSIGESRLSLLSAFGSLTKALLAVVAGALAGRYGGKKVVVGGLVIMAASGAMYVMGARSFAVLCVIRLIQGAGSGLTSGCLMALLSAWFPRRERGTATGAMSCFFGGSVSIATVYAYACDRLGMRWNLTVGLLLLVVGGVMAILLVLFYRDVNSVYGVAFIDEVMVRQEVRIESAPVVREGAPGSWSEVLHFPGFWMTGAMEFFYSAACFGVGFLMPLFIDECGYTGASAASIMTVGTVSSIVTSFLGGIMSDRLFKTRRAETVIIGFGGSALTFALIALFGRAMPPFVLTGVYFISYGVMMLGSAPAWVIPVEIAAPEFASQSLGACITFSGVGGFAATFALGWITERFGIDFGMYLLVFCMAAVALGAELLRRKYRV